jgi:hypothetical protein
MLNHKYNDRFCIKYCKDVLMVRACKFTSDKLDVAGTQRGGNYTQKYFSMNYITHTKCKCLRKNKNKRKFLLASIHRIKHFNMNYHEFFPKLLV